VTARITFAIPYYRNKFLLEKTLLSVISQDREDWRVVVVDDRGGEDAEDVALGFKDSRIRYFRNSTNLGIADNWNKAISLVNTEFVTVLHSDDELEPVYADLMINLLDKYPNVNAAHCRTRVINLNGEAIWSLPDEVKKLVRPKNVSEVLTCGEEGLLSITRGAWIFCPTLCYRREMLPPAPFNNRWQFVLDVDLMARILFDGGSFVGTPKIGYRYRRHLTNQTALLTESTVRFQEEFDHLDIVAQKARDIGWYRVEQSARFKLMVRLHLAYQSLRAILEFRWRRVGPLLVGAFRGQLK
jgi:glycosyltransferase involved in cell wall biosynthesis